MRIKQKLGLIGLGNMGTAVLEGLFEKKKVPVSKVWVCDKAVERVRDFCRKWKTKQASSNGELVRRVGVILLAVKPQDLSEAAAEFKTACRKDHVLISILAGTPTAKLRKLLGSGIAIVRAMPNLGAKAGASMTALAGSDAKALKLAEQVFSGCGETLRLKEEAFDLVTALSGSGPAYFFLLMELLAKAGVRGGLSPGQAEKLAVQTAWGAARLAKRMNQSPEQLRKNVTSKGGTTEAALKVFEDNQLSGLVDKAVQAAVRRGREMSQG